MCSFAKTVLFKTLMHRRMAHLGKHLPLNSAYAFHWIAQARYSSMCETVYVQVLSIDCSENAWEVLNIELDKWDWDYTARIVYEFINRCFNIILLFSNVDSYDFNLSRTLFVFGFFVHRGGMWKKQRIFFHKFSITQGVVILWVWYSFNSEVLHFLSV